MRTSLKGVTLTCQACGKKIKPSDARMMYHKYLIHKWEKCTVIIDVKLEEQVGEYSLGPQHKKRPGS